MRDHAEASPGRCESGLYQRQNKGGSGCKRGDESIGISPEEVERERKREGKREGERNVCVLGGFLRVATKSRDLGQGVEAGNVTVKKSTLGIFKGAVQ